MKRDSDSLIRGPISRGLLFFALPILLSNLFQQLYNAVDSAVVGSFAGQTALAAVGSTGSLINLLIGFFLGFATGAGILFAMRYGAHDWEALRSVVHSAMFLAVAAGGLISVLGLSFARPLLRLMQTPADVMAPSLSYLRIYLAGTVITMVYNVGAGLIRAEGDSKHPLIYLVAGGVTNLVLDILFVAVFRWGVAGAAIATVLAQLVSAVLTVRQLMRLDERYRFRVRQWKVSKNTVRELMRVSVPCGVQSSMFNISNLLVQAEINTFGSVAMAGVAAFYKIDGFVYMPINAISLALTTFVGQNIGAKQYDRIGKGIRVALVSSLMMIILLAVCEVLTFRPLMSLFTKDPAAQEIGLSMMRYFVTTSWIFVFSDILGAAIRGAGDTVRVTVVTALCICVFRVIWLLVMLPIFNDIRMVFLCYPLSWLLNTAAVSVLYFSGNSLRRQVRHNLI